MIHDNSNRRSTGADIILGVLLIALGITFFLGHAFDINLWRLAWPFFIIVPGVLLFAAALGVRGHAGEPLAVLGSVTTVVGALLLYQVDFGHFHNCPRIWRF